jgi:hypothetical protein
MDIQQRIGIGAMVVVGFIATTTNSEKNEEKRLTKAQSEAIIRDVEKAFDKVEKDILDKPVIPDNTPSGPDLDPKKCICKGTGQYERPDAPGSGKMVECPFHGSKDVPTCSCGCDKSGCKCTNGDCKSPPVQVVPSSQPKTYQRRGIFGGRLFRG